MADDVLQQIAGNDTFLLGKAIDNLSLCQNFMGLLGRTVWESHKNGKDIFKVHIGSIEVVGNELRARITYDSMVGTTDIPMFGRVSDIEDFIGKKSAQMVKVLQKNKTYLSFLADACAKMEDWGLRHGRRFSQVEIIKTIIDNENIMVMTLG